MRNLWLSVGLVALWALVGWAQCSEVPYTVGGTTVTLRFCGNLTVSGGTCSQPASNVVQCSVPEGTTGTVTLSAQRTPAGTVTISAASLPTGWPSFAPVSGSESVSGQYRFTVPAGSAGRRFELKFRATASGVPTPIDLTVILDVAGESVPPPPREYQPVMGKTDSEGKFTVTIAPNTTVTGKLTVCTVTPLPDLTFRLTPLVGELDGGGINAFAITAQGYEDLLVTKFSKLDFFIVTIYDLGTLCLKPKPREPEAGPEGGASGSCFHAFWTHGSGVQVENPDSLVSVTRLGYCTSVVGKPNAGGWFHFAVPTPVIGTCYSKAAGQEVGFRYRLLRALIYVHTSGPDVRITRVHVWDGNQRRAQYDDLTITGGPLMQAFDVPGNPLVIYGIGISIRVEFGPAGGWVSFISAGSDFLLGDQCSCR